MKISEVKQSHKYTALVVGETSREKLLQYFPPKYEKVIGHHITVEFGVSPKADLPPQPNDVKVYGYVDSGDGLEVLAVMVDGKLKRNDGNLYHITWSLDPSKYSPKDSNQLLQQQRPKLRLRTIPIQVQPKLLP